MKGFTLEGMHYRQEFVKCGKAACKRCPHGPYWFAYDHRRIFMKKSYVGKKLPPAVEAARKQKGVDTLDPREEAFSPDYVAWLKETGQWEQRPATPTKRKGKNGKRD